MNSSPNLDQARGYAESAFAAMAEQAIPATPANLAIWYAHFSGDNPKLSSTLDALSNRNDPFNQARNEELFQKFLGGDPVSDVLHDASQKVETTIARAVEHLKSANADVAHYGNRLASFSDAVGGNDGQDDSDSLVSGILAETRRMAEKNQALEDRLGQSAKEIADLKTHLEDVRKQAMTDALTGIANRKCFDNKLRDSVRDSMDAETPLCLLMIDIDHFKKFNDNYGHQLGDQVLKLVAHGLREGVKGRDITARYGGEEFAVILPQTELADAITLADQLRCSIAEKRIVRRASGENLGGITLSAGVSWYRRNEPLSDFISRADEALYLAKGCGRNRVMSETQLKTKATG